MPVRGLAIPTASAFATPLGAVSIDRGVLGLVADLPQVISSDSTHAPEHSLEVHLPFLQLLLKDFEVVPFAVGHASAEEVAEVLERLWGADETIIVVSSDLSHYLPYERAQRVDRSFVLAQGPRPAGFSVRTRVHGQVWLERDLHGDGAAVVPPGPACGALGDEDGLAHGRAAREACDGQGGKI